jgi:predicted amidohydrolase
MTRLALVQMRCEKGAVSQNLETIRRTVKEVETAGVDIVLFPEMCMGGYVDPRARPDIIMRLDGPEVADVLDGTRRYQITVCAGFIEAHSTEKPYITQFAARSGQILAVYRKVTIAGDEEPLFSPGDGTVPTFSHGGRICAMALCADVGNHAVFEEAARGGAGLVLHAAAPGLYGAQETRDWQAGFAWWREECSLHLGRYARDLGLTIATATQAGRTIDEDFPGGGYVFGPDGEGIAATPDWTEGMFVVDLPL